MDEPRRGDARFDDLIAGLEAQADAVSAAEDDAAVEELARAAWAEVRLLDRLREGSSVVVEIIDHGPVAGQIVGCGRDLLVIVASDGEWAVPLWGIAALIGDDASAGTGMSGRWGFAATARTWARERSVVRVLRIGSVPLDGTIDRVGADHLDLAEHDPGVPRRPSEVRRTLSVPLASITALRRR